MNNNKSATGQEKLFAGFIPPPTLGHDALGTKRLTEVIELTEGSVREGGDVEQKK